MKQYIVLKGANIKHNNKTIFLKEDTIVIGWIENNVLFFYFNHKTYYTSIYNAKEVLE